MTDMRKSRYAEEQIIGFIKQVEAAFGSKELGRKHGFSDASLYKWRAKFGGMDVSEARRLKELESENAKLKRLLAEAHLNIHALNVWSMDFVSDVIAKPGCPARRIIWRLSGRDTHRQWIGSITIRAFLTWMRHRSGRVPERALV
jgi:putative transposase